MMKWTKLSTVNAGVCVSFCGRCGGCGRVAFSLTSAMSGAVQFFEILKLSTEIWLRYRK